MPERGQFRAVQAGAAAEVEDTGGVLRQDKIMNPLNMLFDDFGAAAGGVVFLGQVFAQHSGAEGRVVPGDFFAFGPGLGGDGAGVQVRD
jgi:hypothetical protein